ncbi:MAG: PilZ domain-containing protein [Candidatus Omnitrophota bacterium]
MGWEGEEKRKFPRVIFPCRIVIGSPIRLLVSHTENIGEGGIRVILEEKLSAHTMVGLEIYVEKEKPIKCKGKVRWIGEKVNPLDRESLLFDTGIEFVGIDEADRQYIRKLVEIVLAQEKK